MASFVVQPGEPLVHVSQEGGKIYASQERFSSDRQLLGTSQQLWTIPLCYRVLAPDSVGSCFLLNTRGQEAKGAPNTIFANASGHGYYRTEYEPPVREQLTKQAEAGLSPSERIFLLDDEWALMRVGRLSISNYLDLVAQLKGERQRQVWKQALTSLEYINDKLVSDRDREQFRQFVRSLLKPEYMALANTTDPEQKALRGDLFFVLGIVGRDPQMLAEARQLTDKALQDPGSVDPVLAGHAMEIAAIQGDEALFNQIVAKLEGTTDQILRERYMDALTHFEKPELVEKALELGISDAIPNQDSTRYISRFVRNPQTRAIAWKFVQTHWAGVEKTFTTSSGESLVSSAGEFCNEDAASNVSAFFKVHPVPASQRALRQAVERVNSCVDLKKLQESNLQTWLIDHSASPVTGGR
jgi:aminopeptidase N